MGEPSKRCHTTFGGMGVRSAIVGVSAVRFCLGVFGGSRGRVGIDASYSCVALIMDAMGIDMADYVITDGNSSSEDGSQLFSVLVSSFSATL